MDNKNNTGNRNSGYYNSGYYNSGDYNSGDCNSGDRNSGYRNSGDYNSGNRNSGYYNSGDYNSGNYNSGDRNSGIFNTNEPKMRMFNKDSEYTYTEFVKKFGYNDIDLPTNVWVDLEDMTEDEKKEFPIALQMNGYLKTLSYKEAWKVAWEKASKEQKEWYQNLPNFDAKIFEEITGIDTTQCEAVKSGDEIEVCIKGKKFKAKIV
jgi:hypothetical protein